MSRPPISAVVPALVLAACGGEIPAGRAPEIGQARSSDEPPYAGGDEAVQWEFEAAEKAGTAAAYRLFAERHPQHARAAEARRRAAALEGGPT